MKTRSIGHLSHGIAETGGYKHEQLLLQAIGAYYGALNTQYVSVTKRIKRYFSGLSHLKLQGWGFVNAGSEINIVVARIALSAIVRNCLNARKILIVLHNYDENDYKGFFLRLYYRTLFRVLTTIPFRNVAIVAVAPFWVDFFKGKVKQNIPVFLFPNLFDQDKYVEFRTSVKKKQIHLGQFSQKNDAHLFNLAKKLTAEGYTCYFSTLFEHEQGVFEGYEVRYGSFDVYLENMAESEYTLAYIAVNEGWNRIAHESLLVGTPVIGIPKGGLGDLLAESGSLIAHTEDDFFAMITRHTSAQLHPDFFKKYDLRSQQTWVKPLVQFCESQ